MKILVLLLVSMAAIAGDYEESRRLERELKEYQAYLRQEQLRDDKEKQDKLKEFEAHKFERWKKEWEQKLSDEEAAKEKEEAERLINPPKPTRVW